MGLLNHSWVTKLLALVFYLSHFSQQHIIFFSFFLFLPNEWTRSVSSFFHKNNFNSLFSIGKSVSLLHSTNLMLEITTKKVNKLLPDLLFYIINKPNNLYSAWLHQHSNKVAYVYGTENNNLVSEWDCKQQLNKSLY